MPREAEGYRDKLEKIIAAFPNKELLCMREVSKFLGIDSRTVKKYFPFKNGYISRTTLAREMP